MVGIKKAAVEGCFFNFDDKWISMVSIIFQTATCLLLQFLDALFV